MKAATLESKFPILSVEHDCIISKDADITVCYRVELPELFTVTQAEYEAIHSAWAKAVKVLPNYSIVHKQDFFIEESYTPELQKEDLSFLSRSFERHFNERPYLKHTCYLFLTNTTKEHGLKVSIDLASFNVVEENRDFLHDIVEKHVDILFANEDEARAFPGESDPHKALEHIAAMCELAVVKIGMRGALIKRGEEMVHVGIMAAAKRVDTTGAGDFYAAGFMYGLTQGLSLRACGTIGAITAGKVIEVVGTTFSEEVWHEIERLIEQVRADKCLF